MIKYRVYPTSIKIEETDKDWQHSLRNVFDTWEEARNYLLDRSFDRVAFCKEALHIQKQYLEDIITMEKPQ